MSAKLKKFCRFDKEMDERLIELVSKNEVLYNSKHKLYKDLPVRDDVWLAISTVVGRSVIECKTRWRSLRDLFQRKKKDVKKGKRCRTQWEYMEMLSFLENFTTERRTERVDNGDDSYEERDEDIANTTDNQLPPNSFMNLIAVPCNISESQINIFKREPMEEDISTEIERIKVEQHREDDFKEENESVQLLREIRDATQATSHPIKMFFDSMASTVMAFPPALAAEAKLKVCQIVTELECRMLDEAARLIDVESDDVAL